MEYFKKLPSFGMNVRTEEAWRQQPGWGWRVGRPDRKRAHVPWERRWAYRCRCGWTMKDFLRQKGMIRLAVAVRWVDWRDLAEATARVQRSLIRGWVIQRWVAVDTEVRCEDTGGRTLQGPLGSGLGCGAWQWPSWGSNVQRGIGMWQKKQCWHHLGPQWRVW